MKPLNTRTSYKWISLILFISLMFQVNFVLIFVESGITVPNGWGLLLIVSIPANVALMLLFIWSLIAMKSASHTESADTKKGSRFWYWAKKSYTAFAISYGAFLVISILVLLLFGSAVFNFFLANFYAISIALLFPLSLYVAHKFME